MTILKRALTNLVFLPIGNQAWAAVDPNALELYGPNGVVLMDAAGKTALTLTPQGIAMSGPETISMTVGSSSVVVTSQGVQINGRLMINGAAYLAHEHSNGNDGDPTGGVISG